MLTLFRGDDLAFAEYDRKVCVRFDTFQDLTGWAAKFSLFDNVKQTTDISSRLWTFGYTAEETQMFPLGKTYGCLVILDSAGQIRQMSKVEVEVVNKKIDPCINGLIAISIDNVIANYNNVGNKPVLNGKTIEGVHDSSYYGLADKDTVDEACASLKGLTDTVLQTSATVADQGEAVANNALQIVKLAVRVKELEEKGSGDIADEIAALKIQIADEIVARTSADKALSDRIDAIDTSHVEELIETVKTLQDTVAGLTEKCDALAKENTDIKRDLDKEVAAREVGDEKSEELVEALVKGDIPIDRFTFMDANDGAYYEMRIEKRDDGNGNKVPAIALDPMPTEPDESSSTGA